MDYKAEFKETVAEAKHLQDLVAEPYGAFGQIHKATMRDGVLTRKAKELIAMCIGINMRCEGCVISHTRGALRSGATLEEIAEAVGVSILMGGGPATVYGAKALEAAKQFSENPS